MRHEPDRVRCLAVKSASKLIVDAAMRHFIQGVCDDSEGAFIARAMMVSQQKFERHRRRKFWSTAKSAIDRIKCPGKARKRRIKQFCRKRARRGLNYAQTPQFADDLIGRMFQLITPRAIS